MDMHTSFLRSRPENLKLSIQPDMVKTFCGSSQELVWTNKFFFKALVKIQHKCRVKLECCFLHINCYTCACVSGDITGRLHG